MSKQIFFDKINKAIEEEKDKRYKDYLIPIRAVVAENKNYDKALEHLDYYLKKRDELEIADALALGALFQIGHQ